MLKTAECVSPKHPDKLCDRISDAILDECLIQDPNTRAAIETMGGHGIITVTGELTTNAYVNVHDIVKSIVGDRYGVQTNIVRQSPEIAKGVDTGGAGDQGIMVGYACRENPEMIPNELYLARSLAKYIYSKYEDDGKTQISIDSTGKAHAIIASWCGVFTDVLKKLIEEWVAKEELVLHEDCKIYANPAGAWDIGGFEADTGVTGRKLAVDNYGPGIPVGGGAFSGKDSTKVDRSGAYAARDAAVDTLQHNEWAKEVKVYLAYAIGVAEPVMAEAHCTDYSGVTRVLQLESSLFTPKAIINRLSLRDPQFEETARWGHMGNGFKWG